MGSVGHKGIKMPERAQVMMSAAEIAAFLATPRTMIIATIGSGGWPHQTAVSFVMDAGSPVFWTYASSQKVRNIERDPRVSCLVEDGKRRGEWRGVALRGRAGISRDPADIERTWRQLTLTYRGSIEPYDEEKYMRQRDKRCVVTVGVERITSWDHHKLRFPA
jgi:PPOX class probable F420-dependent enzyme